VNVEKGPLFIFQGIWKCPFCGSWDKWESSEDPEPTTSYFCPCGHGSLLLTPINVDEKLPESLG